MDNRTENASNILRDAAAHFLSREAGPQSLITITNVRYTSDLSRATIYLSVLPREKETAALGFATRSVREMKDYLKTKTKLPRIPYIEFELDTHTDSFASL